MLAEIARGSLDGARVLVTRPAHQGATLADAVSRIGGRAMRFPVIAIAPPADPDLAGARVARVGESHAAVFVSVNAVDAVASLVEAIGRRPVFPTLVAVGAATRRALELQRWGPVVAPSARFDSEGVLALAVLAGHAVCGRSVVVFKGEGGRDLLARELARRGANVLDAVVYRRALPDADTAPLVDALRCGSLDAAVLTSVEAVDNLFTMAGPRSRARLVEMNFVVVSERVAERLRELGVPHEPVVARRASDEALLAALVGWWSRTGRGRRASA